MHSKNGGFILGIFVSLVAVIITVVVWLYGSKIKQDIKDKLNDQTQQEQQTETEQKQENSNLYITLR